MSSPVPEAGETTVKMRHFFTFISWLFEQPCKNMNLNHLYVQKPRNPQYFAMPLLHFQFPKDIRKLEYTEAIYFCLVKMFLIYHCLKLMKTGQAMHSA